MCVTWNGTVFETDQPVLIYHDEIGTARTEPFTGNLQCWSQHSQSRASWHLPNDHFVDFVNISSRVFQQKRDLSGVPTWSQLSRYMPEAQLTDARYNGLWTCRHSVSNRIISVGLYHRGGGKWHDCYN